MRRKWAERIVIATAAVASIATSPARWRVEATLPPRVLGKATILVLDASQAPEVWIDTGTGGERWLDPTDSERATGERPATRTWPGQVRYFVPAGVQLKRAEIDGRCTVRFCSSAKCKPPETAYIKVVSATAVEGWMAEDRSTPETTVLDPGKPSPSYTVAIESSRQPITLEVDSASRALAPSVWVEGRSGSTSRFRVSWLASNGQAAPVTVTWTAHATIQGECPGAAACTVPAGEAVRIVSVEARPPDAP